MAEPFIIKCVKCKDEFDETSGTYRRICPPCMIQEKEDRRIRLAKERNENKVLEYAINCKYCKNDFLSKSKQRMYCSGTCSTKYHNIPDNIQTKERKRFRGDNKVTDWKIVCKMCKKNFLAYSKQRKYCSHTCRTKFHNIPDDIERTEDRIDRLVLRLEHFKSLIDQ